MKLDNIFYDQNTGFIKVGDLGGAKKLGDVTDTTPILGTRGHMGPEVYEKKIGNFNDIYAFAGLMVNLYTGKAPYDECDTDKEVQNKVSKKEFPDAL